MNPALQELRRLRIYAVAAAVAVGALLVGLAWFVAVAIASVALLAGAGVALWSSPKESPAAERRAHDRPSVPERVDATFRREGEYWTISYRDATFRLHDAKGLGYIHALLASPSVEFHVLDLVVGDAAAPRKAPRDDLPAPAQVREPVLDRQAREAFRRRIEDLRDQIEEAEETGDQERASRAREELDFIARELQRHIRPDGSSRSMPDETERARVNVSRAIRASIAKIAEHDASLGHHLDRDIRTGTYCSYVPDPAAAPSWHL